MRKGRIAKSKFQLIRGLFGIGLLLLIFWKLGVSNIVDTVRMFSIWWLIPLFILNFLIMLLGTLNYVILLRGSETRVPLFRLMKYYILSTTIGLFVPGKLGEFSMVLFLHREGQSLGEASAINVIDKFITLFLVSIIAAVGAFAYLTNSGAIKLVGAIVVLGLSAMFLLSKYGRRMFKKFVLRKYASNFKGFAGSVRQYLLFNKRLLGADIMSTFAKLLLQAAVVYYLFLAFDVNVAFHNVFFINALLIIIMLIPISISGLGVREGGSVVLFSIIGVPPVITISVQVLFLALRYIQGLFAVIFLFSRDTIKIPRKEFDNTYIHSK